MECEQVKALICIGCCYNLLSEECSMKFDVPCGFPLSNFARLASITLGKNARDLACQVWISQGSIAFRLFTCRLKDIDHILSIRL